MDNTTIHEDHIEIWCKHLQQVVSLGFKWCDLFIDPKFCSVCCTYREPETLIVTTTSASTIE